MNAFGDPGPQWHTPEMLTGIVLAFIVGFAIQRGSLCCVAAARQIVEHGRWHRIRAFLLVACWSAVVILPLAWFLPGHAVLSPGYPVGLRTVAAAFVYSVGAWLNAACAFGTLAGLTRGETGFFASIAGMIAGAVLSVPIQPPAPDPSVLAASVLAAPSWPALAAWAAAALLVLRGSLRHLRASHNRPAPWRTLARPAHWRPATAMAVLGIFGGVLYACEGEWTYLSVLSDRSAALVRADDAAVRAGPVIVCAAMLAGGLAAAWLGGRFVRRRAARGMFLRRFAGGGLMSGAAAILPGGNDALLLYGLPSAAPHALVGYAVMILSLCLLMALVRRITNP